MSEVATIPQNNETTLLTVIERVASNPDVDIERMQALLTMRAEEEQRQRQMAREDRDEESRRAFLKAFSEVQSEIGPIFRGRKNEHTRSTFAALEDIERTVTPILTKHGFSTTAVPVPCDKDQHIRVRLTIGHAEGHERHYEDDFPLDGAGAQGKVNKTPIQAKGSTQTYGRRYLKASALDLSFTDDNDGNAAPAETISQKEADTLRKKIEKLGRDEAKLCAHYQVDTLESLSVDKFDQAIRQLNRMEAEAKKANG